MKIYKFLTIFIAAVGILAVAGNAQAAVSLSLSPSSGSYEEGEEFSVEIRIDTNGENVDAVLAEVELSSELSFVGSEADIANSALSTEFRNEISGNTLMLELADFSNYLNDSNGYLGSFQVKAENSGTAEIRFTNNSGASGEGELSSNFTNAQYTINSGGGGEEKEINLSLSPSSGSYEEGEEFSVEIRIDTNGENVDAVLAEVELSSELSFVGSEADIANSALSTEFRNEISGNTLMLELADFSNYLNDSNGYLGSFQVKAENSGTAEIRFTNNSGASGENELEIISAGAEYSVESGGTGEEKEVEFYLFPEGKSNKAGVDIEVKIYKNEELKRTISGELYSNGKFNRTVNLSSFLERDEWSAEIYIPYYLKKRVNLTFETNENKKTENIYLLAGDLSQDNVINELDWSVMSGLWFSASQRADINGDGEVNSLDWHYLNENWGLKGD